MSSMHTHFLRRLLLQRGCVHNAIRSIVSPAFSCSSAWDERLKSQALSKIDSGTHFRKVKQAFDSGSFVAAIDMDIVSNKLNEINPLSLELLDNLYYKFRHSKETVNILDSTAYAFFRTLMDCNEHEKILDFLENKPDYGLFLDSHMAAMLMDHFLEKKSHSNAVRVVFDLMLQEEFDDPIVRALSFFACHEFIRSNPDLKIEAPPAPPQNEEIIYRRVSFIDNPWYDDHFDLYSINQKLGKSLTMLCSADDAVSRGYLFIGQLMFLKFEEAMSILKSWMDKYDSVISGFHLSFAESLLQNIETSTVEVPTSPGLVRLGHLLPRVSEEQKAKYIQEFEALKERLVKENKVTTDDVDEYMKNMISKTLAEHEKGFIENQKKTFEQWNKNRDTILNDHLKKLSDRQKKDDIARRLIDLMTKEEKLRYFEEKVNIDLALEGRPEYPEVQDVIIEEQFVAAPNERRLGNKKDLVMPAASKKNEQAVPAQNGKKEKSVTTRNGKKQKSLPTQSGKKDKSAPAQNGKKEKSEPAQDGKKEKSAKKKKSKGKKK